jgi:[ribosomal protein S5]-alanine N-acetyltransferase
MLQLNFTPFPVLESDRLLLRQITLDDAEDLFYLRSNEEVMKYIDRPRPKSIEDIHQLIHLMEENLQLQKGISWAITLKQNPKQHLGNIGFWRIVPEHYRAEIGYLLNPAFHKQGIMQEAIELSLDYAFTKMNLHTVEAGLNNDNIASHKVLQKTGFVQEGLFKENYYCNGEFTNSAIYSIINPHH